MHTCSNPDSCQLKTEICQRPNDTQLTDMSNKTKVNNQMVLSELSALDEVSKKRLLDTVVEHDFQQLEIKKREVNKELIKL